MKNIRTLTVIILTLCLLSACSPIDKVQKQISSIGEVTESSGDAIKQAQDSYDSLSDDEKKKVNNYEELVNAQKTYKAIGIAQKFNEQLGNLDDNIDVSNLYQVKALRTSYDVIPENVRSYVTNIDKLTSAESTLWEIYRQEYERLVELVNTANETLKSKPIDGVTNLRALQEAIVLCEELQAFDYPNDDVKIEGYRNLDEMHDELLKIESKYPNTLFYEDTGIVKLDYIIGIDLSSEFDEKRYTDKDDEPYADQFHYIYMPDHPIGERWRDQYLAYLDEHFTKVDTTEDEDDGTLYNYEDDLGNTISVHFRLLDFSSLGTIDCLQIYFDKAIVEKNLHGYNGKNPLAGKLVQYAAVGDTVLFGNYEQNNNTDDGKEPIEWIVLDEDEDGLMLMSKDVITAHVYKEERVETTWEDSDCRAFLNNEFLTDAFSDQEKEDIRITHLVAESNPKFGTDAGSDTDDKVFILNVQQVMKYFPDPEERLCNTNLYMKSMGVQPDENGHAAWGLRTPGKEQTTFVACARNSGYFIGTGDMEIELKSAGGGLYVDAKDCCYRPVIWISVKDRYIGLEKKDFE